MTVRKSVKQAATAKVVEEKAQAQATKTASAVKSKDHQLYISREEEIMNFDVVLRGVRYSSFWDADKEHIMFKIAKDHIEAFEAHEHFVKGRFTKAEG